MNMPTLGDLAGKARLPDPHEKIAERIRRFTSRRIRFRPRTRAILVFIGAIAVILAWLTPWYVSMTWMTSGTAIEAALHAGYVVTNLSPGDMEAKYGLNPMLREVTGRQLAAQPGALGAIAFSRTYFYEWIGLAVLALVAMWTHERPETLAVNRVRRLAYKYLEHGKVILLVFVAAQALWKGVDIASKAKVNSLALQQLGVSLHAAGVPTSAAGHFMTNYSTGIALLLIGLICAALGVLSGDKESKLDAFGNQVAARVRVPAGCFAVAAVLVIVIGFALFTG
jgi:hypothetical protein